MSNEPKKDAQVTGISGEREKNETTAPVEELNAGALNQVVGGRKAGKDQQEFLVVKMNDVIITS